MTHCTAACPHFRCRQAVAVWCAHERFASEVGHEVRRNGVAVPEIHRGRYIREPREKKLHAPPEWCPLSTLRPSAPSAV